ncbi:amidohydrolase family protein [Lacrimispora sp.]|uniref:amidohydrolase family protein n=1 Tax=Lacrimispora sp. TaxID=2719234 RepID=UPI003995684E
MIIDGHSHITLPVEEHIKAMDAAGIDKTVLFSTTFHPEAAKDFTEVQSSMEFLHEMLAGKKGSMVEVRQKAVSELMGALKQYPDRYIGFGAVPAGLELKPTLQYVAENIQNNHLAGMGEFTPGSGQIHLLKNVFKASQEFCSLPIWIHAFFPLTFQDIKDISELARDYPETPVILGHLGGSNWLETVALVKEVSNLYLDTSAYYSTFVLASIINEVPEKCFFGVDHPFGDLQISKNTILQFAKTPAIANAVLGENIARLLKIM